MVAVKDEARLVAVVEDRIPADARTEDRGMVVGAGEAMARAGRADTL